MTRRRLTEDDKKIWRRVSRTVTPMKDRPAPIETPDQAANPDPSAIQADPKGRSGIRHTVKPPKARTPPKAPPADLGGDKRVRRGRAAVDARLDLHGHTQDSARAALVGFVTRQRAQGAQCVLVITGKGRLGAGVLKARFLDWLSEPELRVHISGYAQAHQRHGGGGAFYVFLKRLKASNP
ncbi:MAG: Smr/MutS family protein [Pseudomonadota bacterium]